MGPKFFIGTPWMPNEGVLKKIWFGLCENAWFPWQPMLRHCTFTLMYNMKNIYHEYS